MTTGRSVLLLVCVGLVSAFACKACAAPIPGFRGLDLPGNADWSIAYGVSGDGLVVAGAAGVSPASQAFRWPEGQAPAGLGYLAAGDDSQGLAVDATGSTIVGWSGPPVTGPLSLGQAPTREAFSWTSAAGMNGLGQLPGAGVSSSAAQAVSADGSVVVGQAYGSQGYEAFRWTEADGMNSLGVPQGFAESMATGVSSDGSSTVGAAWTWSVAHGLTAKEAFAWDHGMAALPLGRLTGDDASEAHAVSADGSVAVGKSFRILDPLVPVIGEAHAFRWDAVAGMEPIGDLPGGIVWSEATAVSADGSVIVGASESDAGLEAFLWRDGLGIVSVEDLLASFGVDTAGWHLQRARGVSADGLTIVGTGIDPGGVARGWIATVPEPATMSLVGIGISILLVARHRLGAPRGNA